MNGVDMSSMSVWSTVVIIVAVVVVVAVLIWAIVMLARGGKSRKPAEDGRDARAARGEKVEIETVYVGGNKNRPDAAGKAGNPAKAEPEAPSSAPASADAGYVVDPKALKKARKALKKARKAAAKAQEATEKARIAQERAVREERTEPVAEAASAAEEPARADEPVPEPVPEPEDARGEIGPDGKTVKAFYVTKDGKTGLWNVCVEGEDSPVGSFLTETEALTYAKSLAGGRDVRIAVERKKPEAR